MFTQGQQQISTRDGRCKFKPAGHWTTDVIASTPSPVCGWLLRPTLSLAVSTSSAGISKFQGLPRLMLCPQLSFVPCAPQHPDLLSDSSARFSRGLPTLFLEVSAPQSHCSHPAWTLLSRHFMSSQKPLQAVRSLAEIKSRDSKATGPGHPL